MLNTSETQELLHLCTLDRGIGAISQRACVDPQAAEYVRRMKELFEKFGESHQDQ